VPIPVAIFATLDGQGQIDLALEAMTRLNVGLLRGRSVPTLYSSGVRYAPEIGGRDDHGREAWLTVPELYARGRGDCEDLACALAAEYRRRGIAATAIAKPSTVGFHIVVRTPDGKLHDPSRVLGMGR
jgi:hypothetical protein